MNNVIEVLFVVPKNYLDYATAISEELSKQDNFVSKCYEVKEFQSKAIPESVNRFFISIGDAKENDFSREIIMNADKLEQEPGKFIATYKSYAVIFGESDYSLNEFLKDSLNDSYKTLGNIANKSKEKFLSTITKEKGPARKVSSINESESLITTGVAGTIGTIAAVKTVPIIGKTIGIRAAAVAGIGTTIAGAAVTHTLVIGGIFYLKKNTKRAKIKQDNTKVALAKFFKEIFPSWISNTME